MAPSELAEPTDKLVLIVDDDEGIQDYLSMMLKAEGFRVAQAYDGREALRKVEQLLPDIILLDMMFPRHGGHEIMIQLQSDEAAAEIPIVAMTGHCKDSTTQAAIRAEPNVVEFLEKPLKREKVLSIVHKTLNTRPARALASGKKKSR